MIALWVAVGAAIGAPARYLVGEWTHPRFTSSTVPATLVVNTIGSFLLGWAVAVGLSGSAIALVGVGFCGAFTTFSSYALQLFDELQNERLVEFALHLIASLVLGLGAAWLGFVVGG